ncbi:hypothetical protein [Ancylobacter sp.]
MSRASTRALAFGWSLPGVIGIPYFAETHGHILSTAASAMALVINGAAK